MKASIAGAIVTNSLFMLGASFLLGGLKHHVQEYNRAGARLQAGLLFLATVALLVPSAVSQADSTAGASFTGKISVCLSVLLVLIYSLGLFFSLKTHREFFANAEHGESDEKPWPVGLAVATLAGVTILVALVSVGIALGSASQIALFVAPVLVLLSYALGPMPMNLQFWPGTVVMMLIATLTVSLVTSSGRSAWFVGVAVMAVYLILAMTLYLLPPKAQ